MCLAVCDLGCRLLVNSVVEFYLFTWFLLCVILVLLIRFSVMVFCCGVFCCDVVWMFSGGFVCYVWISGKDLMVC